MILLVLSVSYLIIGMYTAVLYRQYTEEPTHKQYLFLTFLWPVPLYKGLRAKYHSWKGSCFDDLVDY